MSSLRAIAAGVLLFFASVLLVPAMGIAWLADKVYPGSARSWLN